MKVMRGVGVSYDDVAWDGGADGESEEACESDEEGCRFHVVDSVKSVVVEGVLRCWRCDCRRYV